MAETKSTQALKAVPRSAPLDNTARQGLNAKQQEAVLEDIACRAETLCRLLALMQQGPDASKNWELQTHIESALVIAQRIGAMADTAVNPDGEIVGDANTWTLGPNFNELGKEANHG